MRVIAGKHKGRQVRPVPSNQTRPTTDKAKEALFQVIGPYFDGGLGLDLFAGSGGLGIEALSRGLDEMIFVDRYQKAISTIYENLKMLKIEDQAEVYRTDAFRAIKAAGKRELKFDWIFLDPPYEKVSFEDILEALHEQQVVAQGATIVCEHTARQSLPEQIGPFEQMKSATYSSIITISLYQYKD